jgi:putative transposase
MTYNHEIHKRHSIRLENYDYTENSAYFVTICTYRGECLLGEIVDREMIKNSLGFIAEEELKISADKRPNFKLDIYTIMPNHIHFIVFIETDVGAMRCIAQKNKSQPVGAMRCIARGQSTGLPLQKRRGSAPGSVNEFVGNYKSFTSKRINQINNSPSSTIWQRNYYEHIIRDKKELLKIRQYIHYNSINWDKDENNPVNINVGVRHAVP